MQIFFMYIVVSQNCSQVNWSGWLILNGKSTFCLYEEIYFICVTYLFDLGLVFKFLFSLVIYIYIIFKLCYLADAFIQSDLHKRGE